MLLRIHFHFTFKQDKNRAGSVPFETRSFVTDEYHNQTARSINVHNLFANNDKYFSNPLQNMLGDV